MSKETIVEVVRRLWKEKDLKHDEANIEYVDYGRVRFTIESPNDITWPLEISVQFDPVISKEELYELLIDEVRQSVKLLTIDDEFDNYYEQTVLTATEIIGMLEEEINFFQSV